MRINYFLLAFVAIVLYTSCGSNDQNVDGSVIEKDWVAVGGKRDGKKTSTLDGLYLKFHDGMLTSNYLGSLIEEPYIFNSENNTVHIGQQKGLLIVNYLTSDSMHVTTEIRQTKFDFYLK